MTSKMRIGPCDTNDYLQMKKPTTKTLSTNENTTARRTTSDNSTIYQLNLEESSTVLDSRSNNFPKWVPETMIFEILFEFTLDIRNRNRHQGEIEVIIPGKKLEEGFRGTKRWLKPVRNGRQNIRYSPALKPTTRTTTRTIRTTRPTEAQQSAKKFLITDFFCTEKREELVDELVDSDASFSSCESVSSESEDEVTLIVDHIVQEVGVTVDFDLEGIVRELVQLEEGDLSLMELEEIFGLGRGGKMLARTACFNVYAKLMNLL